MNQPQIIVPEINLELVRIKAALPVKLAELSRINKDAALLILQDWGEGVKPLKVLYKDVIAELDAATSN